MSEGRLNALLYVHKDIQLDFEEVVTTYGNKHPRRMLLGRPLDAWFLHVEHLLLDLPDLPSDFKYFVNIVNTCTNYLTYSLSDFSEIIPKVLKNAYLRIAIFKIFRGSMPPGPPRGGEGKPSPWSLRDHKFWGSQSSMSPRDSNPGSATEWCIFLPLFLLKGFSITTYSSLYQKASLKKCKLSKCCKCSTDCEEDIWMFC